MDKLTPVDKLAACNAFADPTRSPAGGSVLAGSAAALVTVSLWAGWIIATRFAGESSIDPIVIGLLRYGPPAVLLAPVWLRCGLLPQQCPWWVIALMVSGSGAPFFLLAAFATQIAPAAQVGVLLPGAMPLWAALIGVMLGSSHVSRWQWLGYGLIALGIVFMVSTPSSATPVGDIAKVSSHPAWLGQSLLLLGAASWAVYSHAFKRSGLTPLQGVAIVAAWSSLINLLLAACFGLRLDGITPHLLMGQLLVQGILSGLVAIFSYGFAVTTLGAARAAAFSALTPVLAAIGGAILLGEIPRGGDLVSITLVTLGVALASGLTASPALSNKLGSDSRF